MAAEFCREKIREVREARALTQAALGQAIEKVTGRRVESRDVYRWEAGITTPSAVCLLGLCSVAGKPIQYFFSFPVKAKRKPTAAAV